MDVVQNEFGSLSGNAALSIINDVDSYEIEGSAGPLQYGKKI